MLTGLPNKSLDVRQKQRLAYHSVPRKSFKMKKIVKRFVITALCLAACALAALAQTSDARVNDDPNQAKFVTSDIDRIWAMRF